jgi:parallel beta-helix repeat protein
MAATSTPASAQSQEDEFVRKNELVFNVRDYGAVGDGATDDTDAIQSALDTPGPQGGVVYVPRGTYLLLRALRVPTKVHFLGAGRASSILRLASGAAGGTVVATGGSDVTIQRLVLDANDQVTPPGDAVILLHSRSSIEDCDVKSWHAWAIAAYTTSPASSYANPAASSPALGDVTIRNNRMVGRDAVVSNFSNQGGVYIAADVHDFDISGNYLEASEGAPETGSFSGIQADTASRGVIDSNRLICKNRVFDGIVLWGAREVTVSGNIVDKPHDDGITYRRNTQGAEATRVSIVGNILLDCGTSGILCPGGGPYAAITIIGNVVRGTGLDGIRFGGVVGSACIGNTIQDAANYGIDVLPSGAGGTIFTTDSVVADNTILSSGWSGIHIFPGCERNIVKGNICRSCGARPDGPNGNGIYVEAKYSEVAENLVTQSRAHGVLLNQHAARSSVRGNNVVENGHSGIFAAADTGDLMIEGNHVIGNAQYGVLLYLGGKRNSVTGNRIFENGRTGIRALGQSNGLISGNLVMNNGRATDTGSDTHGVRLYECTRVVVTGNKIGDDQSTTTQNPQIREDASSSHNTIVGNDLTPGGAPILQLGSASKVAHNMGIETHTT